MDDKMLKPTINIILNKKSGEIGVDDELICSRSDDVWLKTLSLRKAGKEDPVAVLEKGHCFGIRLRVKGEKEIKNQACVWERESPSGCV